MKKRVIRSIYVKAVLSILISFSLSFAFIQTYKSEREIIKKFHLTPDHLTVYFEEQEPEFISMLDSFGFSQGDRFLEARGWVMRVGYSDLESYVNILFLLKNNHGEYFRVKTVKQLGQDVADYINDGIDFDGSGFIARGLANILPEGKYQACLLFTEKSGVSHLIIYDQYIEVQRRLA